MKECLDTAVRAAGNYLELKGAAAMQKRKVKETRNGVEMTCSNNATGKTKERLILKHSLPWKHLSLQLCWLLGCPGENSQCLPGSPVVPGKPLGPRPGSPRSPLSPVSPETIK